MLELIGSFGVLELMASFGVLELIVLGCWN
jgi:hypothetical protein